MAAAVGACRQVSAAGLHRRLLSGPMSFESEHLQALQDHPSATVWGSAEGCAAAHADAAVPVALHIVTNDAWDGAGFGIVAARAPGHACARLSGVL